MFKNKGLTLLLCFFFAFVCGLQSQDFVTDLRKANQLLTIAQERDRVAAEALQEVKSRRQRLEEDLTDTQENATSMSKSEKKKLKSEIKSLQKKEVNLMQRRRYANNLLLDVTDILQATPKKRTKFISEYEKRFGVVKLDQSIGSQSVKTVVAPPVEEHKPGISKPVGKKGSHKTTIADLEKSVSNPPQPFVGSDVVAPAPTDSDNKETEITTKAVKNSKTKTVASKEAKTPKSTSNKTDKKKSEPKEKQQKEVVIAEPKDKKQRDRRAKDKVVTGVMTRPESSKTAVNYKKFDPKDDVMLNTPSNLDCNLAFDGLDNFTGKKKQETTSITLFAHTDDFMRAAMKEKDFVKCQTTATRVEGSRIVYLNLTMTIQTKDAQRTFGFLDRGALIIFRLINGKRISLSTNKTDIGVVDVEKGTTTFRAQLAVAEIAELTQSELDVVRVSWSAGYEDYEIFDMDVLRNLFKCLDKK